MLNTQIVSSNQAAVIMSGLAVQIDEINFRSIPTLKQVVAPKPLLQDKVDQIKARIALRRARKVYVIAMQRFSDSNIPGTSLNRSKCFGFKNVARGKLLAAIKLAESSIGRPHRVVKKSKIKLDK